MMASLRVSDTRSPVLNPNPTKQDDHSPLPAQLSFTNTARGGTPSISPILVTTGEQIIYTRSILEFLSGVPKPSLLTRQTTLKTEQTDGRIEQTNVEVVSHDTLRVLHQFENP